MLRAGSSAALHLFNKTINQRQRAGAATLSRETAPPLRGATLGQDALREMRIVHQSSIAQFAESEGSQKPEV